MFAQSEGYRMGMGMPYDVGKSFLSYAEAGGFDNRIEAVIQRVSLEFSLQSGQGGLAVGVPPQGGVQSQIVKH